MQLLFFVSCVSNVPAQLIPILNYITEIKLRDDGGDVEKMAPTAKC